MKIEFILYIKDQKLSRDFYKKVLLMIPTLDVPGMTEFTFNGSKLGLMPSAGISKLLGPAIPDPQSAAGVPRCELYLNVNDVNEFYERAVRSGAKEISKPAKRNWGDTVGYVSDPDGHIIAFASSVP